MTSLSVLFTADQIHARLQQLARQIEEAYPINTTVHVVCVLRGGFVFTTDLVKSLHRPTTVDFVRLSSYGTGTESSGSVTWHLRPDNVRGREVLIVEDIIDTGHTLDVLHRYLLDQRPASLKTVTMLDKPARRRRTVQVDFVGFTLDDPNIFVVGYGLDLDQCYRELPYIARHHPETQST